MATLGNTGTPDTAVAYYRPRIKAVYVGTMPEDGTLNSASIYCDSSAIEAQDFAIGVYNANGSDYPDNLVSSAATTGALLTAGWVTTTLSGSLTSGQYIWVGFAVHPTNNSNTFRMYGTAAGGLVNVRQGDNATGTYPTFPSTWTNDDTFTQNQPAVYITYTASGGAVKHLRNQLFAFGVGA